MRILNLEGRYFVSELKKLGHEVLCIGQGPGSDLNLESHLSLKDLLTFLQARRFQPEVILWCDTCRPPGVIGFEALPAVTIGFSIDQYCNPWHYPYSAAFDLMLVAQKDYLPLFERMDMPRPVRWFPLFCDENVDVDPGSERDIPVSFVGTLEDSINTTRKPFFNAFKRLHPLYLRQGEYAPVFGRSRIVLNQSAAGELNFRIFQAAACGAAVLTEDTGNGLRDLFTPHKDILPPYKRGDARDAARIARKSLADPEGLRAVARAGRDLVRRRHSVRARTAALLRWTGSMLRDRAFAWRLQNQGRIRKELAKAFHFLATDVELALPLNLREFFAGLGERYRSAG